MPQATRRIKQYEVLGPIGRGGMATVYLAFDEDLGRHVALKELDLRDNESDLVARFMQESRMAAGLGHQNIITVFARLEEDGVPFIAMEYLDQGSLRQHVGNLTHPQIFGVLEGTLAGLDHAHRKDLVHRDLKPENLLITSEGTVKIADFGIAKAVTSATRGLTKRSAILGTPTYMAPEQVTNKPVGPSTDLYSLGVIAFELFCGRVPFEESDEPMAVLFRHVNEPAPAPSSLNPEIEPGLSRWIEKLLAKDPAERPQSADDAWEELEDIVVPAHGPTWRRRARLPTGQASAAPSKPLTPAPFEETPTPDDRTPPPEDRAPPPPPPPREPPPAPREPERKQPAPKPAPQPKAPADRALRARRLAAGVAAVAGLVLIGASFMSQFDDPGQSFWEGSKRVDVVVTLLAAALIVVAAIVFRSRARLPLILLVGITAALYGWWCNHPFFADADVGAWLEMGVSLIAFAIAVGVAARLLPRRGGGRAAVLLAAAAAALATGAVFVDYFESAGSIWEDDFKRGLFLGPPAAALVLAGAAFVAGRGLRNLAALVIGGFVAGHSLLALEYAGFIGELGLGFVMQVTAAVVATVGCFAALVALRRA